MLDQLTSCDESMSWPDRSGGFQGRSPWLALDARNHQTNCCQRDLIIHFAFLAESSLEVARRFRNAAEKSFSDLAAMPGMGVPRRVLGAKFAGLRMWRVRGFENHLIFYRPLNNGIAIERVIHAKQDLQRALK